MSKSCSVEEAREVLANADCCYTEVEVNAALDRMAASIEETFSDKNPLILCVMNGGLITTSSLILRLGFPLQYDYIHATRYRGKTSGGELDWIAKPTIALQERHVIVVDDIFDEGITLTQIVDYCRQQQVASVTSVALVNKLHERKFGPTPDIIGVEVDDRYVFGFGMDYKGYLRNASGIYAVKDS